LRTAALAVVAVVSLAGSAQAQVTPFSTDVSTAIDRGLDYLRLAGAYTSCHDTQGLTLLALLEKRQSADYASEITGYEHASAADQALMETAVGFILNNTCNFGVATGDFYRTYLRGENLMAVSTYARTGGPEIPLAAFTLRGAIDRITDDLTMTQQVGGFNNGFWEYQGPGNDSSTTQYAVAGLASAKGYYLDVVAANPGDAAAAAKLVAINDALDRTEQGYKDRQIPVGVDAGGFGYRTSGYSPSYQQTASALWGTLLGGPSLNDAFVQRYLRWQYNNYNYETTDAAYNFWPQSYYYYLWSSSKAYTLLEDAGAAPDPGNIDTLALGTNPAGPIFLDRAGNRLAQRDPSADPRVPSFGPEGPGYYDHPNESARWFYDYAYTLLTHQGANGRFNATTNGGQGTWHNHDGQAYAILVLERSLGGACVDGDADGDCDDVDNCPTDANPDQEDADGDGAGDACDVCPNDADDDADGDGICGDVDACPNDPDNDADGDGICGDVDTCPLDPNNDADTDGVCGDVDNCPDVSNADQLDTDGDGIGDVCDNQAPVCTVQPRITLWPPNHELVAITLGGAADPDGDTLTFTVTGIFQDEPLTDEGQGAGNTSPDATVSPVVQVRAERNGNPKTPGNGRVYYIDYTVSDPSGASCQATQLVCVPHDNRPGASCQADGRLFPSTQQ
jgi:hypothetical protein